MKHEDGQEEQHCCGVALLNCLEHVLSVPICLLDRFAPLAVCSEVLVQCPKRKT